MATSDTNDLAHALIESGLLGDQSLLDDDSPDAPAGYELVHEIGRGGGGSVFLAQDQRLDRPVAIKYLSSGSTAAFERFQREARYAARLEDASIVRVYDFGEIEARPYIVMQYIEGANLMDADLDHHGVARAIREIAIALDHAHAAGIVHRDIKPQNILIDRTGRAFLTDFGIAHDLQRKQGDTISHDGQIIGTPELMPPEQARGDIQSIDARSDIYAMGSSLYVKLTGRYPFHGRTLLDLLHAVVDHDPPMPRSLNASIPRALEEIILRCMRKPRDDRYQSMKQLIDALDRFLAGDSSGMGGSSWFRTLIGKRTGVEIPEPPRTEAPDPYWSISHDIMREIAAWDADIYRVSGSLDASFRRLDATRERLEAIVAARPDLAWARFYRGVVLFRRGRLVDALDEMERSIDRVGDTASAFFELGRLYLALYLREHHAALRHLSREGTEEDLGAARKRIRQAVRAFEESRKLQGHAPHWHDSYTRAVTEISQLDFRGCVETCDDILNSEPDLEEVWKLRGDALRLSGEDSIESYDRALMIRRSYYEALEAKARALSSAGRLEDARAALEHACSIHSEYEDGLTFLARIFLKQSTRDSRPEDLERGIDIADRAVRLNEQSYDAHLIAAELRIALGRMTNSPTNLTAAVKLLDDADELPGCQNRVGWLKATARFEQARQARSAGKDAQPLLQDILDLCARQSNMSFDHDAWDELAAEVKREMQGDGKGG